MLENALNKLLIIILLIPSLTFAYTDKYYSEGSSSSGFDWVAGLIVFPFLGFIFFCLIKEILRLIFKIDFDDEDKKFDQWKTNAIKKTKIKSAKKINQSKNHEIKNNSYEVVTDPTIEITDKLWRRNKLCPCGSNKKFKHCHGNLKQP